MSSLDLRDSKTTEVSTNVNKVALVVGVNSSVNSTYSAPLSYAEHDAYEIAWTLQQPACNFTLLESPLRGKEANTWNTRRAVIKLAKKRSAQDFLLFYFCGHALPMKTKGDRKDIYFLTYDFNEEDVQADPTMYLSMRWLWDILYQQSEAGRVLLILDCCYAGNMIKAGVDPFQIDLRKLMEEWYQGSSGREQKDRQRLILMSTGYDTPSQEKDGHGFMTGLFLPALRGEIEEVLDDDGQVDIHSLYKYLRKNMYGQPPNLSGEFGPYNCILAVHSNPPAWLRKKVNENELKNETERNILTKLFELYTETQHNQPFDFSICYSASLSDLDLTKVSEFFKQERTKQDNDFRPGALDQELLLQFSFLLESTPTYGALLCFGQTPSKWVSGAITRCADWSSNGRLSGLADTREFRGGLLRQFEQSRDFLRKSLRLNRVIGKQGSTEEWEIPFRVLDEALANALVHREYSNRTDFVQVEVFDDRVEISSPGSLPLHMTLEALQVEHASHPRNPQIAGIFYLQGYIEKLGTGIERMQSLMKDAGLPEPRFELSEDERLTVILYRPKQISEETAKPQESSMLPARYIFPDFSIDEYVQNPAMIRKLNEEKDLALVELRTLKDRFEEAIAQTHMMALEKRELQLRLEAQSSSQHEVELQKRSLEISLSKANQKLYEANRRSFLQFLLTVIATIIISFGINIVTSMPPAWVGWILTALGIILEIIAFVIAFLPRSERATGGVDSMRGALSNKYNGEALEKSSKKET